LCGSDTITRVKRLYIINRRTSGTLALALMLVLLSGGAAQAQLGFLGPRGTFSEEAAEAYRESAPGIDRTIPFDSMTAVVEALRDGTIERGILPLASTVAGFPAESEKLLLSALDPGFRVVAEIVLPIDLHLMVKPGTPRHRIRRILSHPNALGEAYAFLDASFSDASREETSSTAAAAEIVQNSDEHIAAVASVAAARLYGLDVIESAIQADPHNATSFWILAKPESARVGESGTRLVLLLEAPSGSSIFSETMARLADAGLAVVIVNSTPLPGALYGFRYLVSLVSERPIPTERLSTALEPATRAGSVLRLGWFGAKDAND